MAAVLVLTAATALSPAQSAGEPPPPQPSVSLPAKDILNPDAAPANGAGRPASGEGEREIRRPAERGGRMESRVAAQQGAGASAGDERPVSKQAGAKGFWRLNDFLPLAIVLALVLAAAWAVKRYMPARRLVTGAGVLEVVARLPLNSRQNLVLVKMGRQLILVGVSPDRLSTLCLVDDPDRVAELIGRIASQAPDSAESAFVQSLDDHASEFEAGADPEVALSGAGGGVRSLLEKVKRLSRSEVS